MQHLIEFFLIHLVKHPAELSVQETTSSYKKIYEVEANAEDIGLIIGRGGKTIKAVQRVASILADELDERFEIKVKS